MVIGELQILMELVSEFTKTFFKMGEALLMSNGLHFL